MEFRASYINLNSKKHIVWALLYFETISIIIKKDPVFGHKQFLIFEECWPMWTPPNLVT